MTDQTDDKQGKRDTRSEWYQAGIAVGLHLAAAVVHGSWQSLGPMAMSDFLHGLADSDDMRVIIGNIVNADAMVLQDTGQPSAEHFQELLRTINGIIEAHTTGTQH